MDKKFAMLVMAVICAASVVGGATFAWFTSEVESAGSVIVTGDLALDVERVHDNPGEGLTYVFDNIQPGDRAGNWGTTPGMTELSWIVTNEGSIDGKLKMKIDDVEGALGMQIRPQYWVRNHAEGGWKWESGEITEGNIATINLGPGETARLNVTWAFGWPNGDTVINDYQGKSVNFDVVFDLQQSK
ncbi:TasA family protein [Proteinivorax hydrogeniformans]|uniref:TasA family protein n=1 Tax=Proteinivorax hydrogeniformans TaxID=1826727 RepID=A0AAU8HQR4_9FIRM